MQKGWRYYNYALIPTTAPHECVDENVIKTKGFWKNWNGYPMFARWTSDYDCGYATDWWYVIKDSPFNINTIKSKKRYEINKGNKNFEVKIINATDYAEELYLVTKKAYSQYPEKYRPSLEHDSFVKSVASWSTHEVYAAFFRESGALCGYAWVNVYESYLDFCVLKADPKYERYAINAAMVYAIVNKYSDVLGKEFYICDGARATVHETNFQDYLEKYFEFRKAYCKLNVAYPFYVRVMMKVIYPFKGLFKKDGKIGSKIYNVMYYDSIAKNNKRL